LTLAHKTKNPIHNLQEREKKKRFSHYCAKTRLFTCTHVCEHLKGVQSAHHKSKGETERERDNETAREGKEERGGREKKQTWKHKRVLPGMDE